MQKIQLVAFDPAFAADFARLNYEWIEKYFRIEDHDREVLGDPNSHVIEKGGEIFFAMVDGEVIGTVAMIPVRDDEFELAKMAVSVDHRGKGVGDHLIRACIKFARQKGRSRIFLLSNTKLAPAINLYRKHGFVEVNNGEQTPYDRVNIRMELALAQHNL